MDPAELDAMLDGASETDALEFKSAIDWNFQTFLKDILALSNVRRGGQIVVGVNENANGFDRVGLSPEQQGTYNLDVMRDQIAPYADPHVNFDVSFAKDTADRTCAIIRVSEFDVYPTICARDGPDNLHVGVVYYRSPGGRPASAGVSNAADMRDILDRAAFRLMRRYRSLVTEAGFIEPEQPALEAELGDL